METYPLLGYILKGLNSSKLSEMAMDRVREGERDP
jgi:hypothetical protein